MERNAPARIVKNVKKAVDTAGETVSFYYYFVGAVQIIYDMNKNEIPNEKVAQPCRVHMNISAYQFRSN